MKKETSAQELFEYLKLTGASLDRESWMSFNVTGKCKVKLNITQAACIGSGFKGFGYNVKTEEIFVELSEGVNNV